MEMHLNEYEIKQALLEHISNTGVSLKDTVTKVTLIAGRKEKGHSAIISIHHLPGKVPDTEEELEDTQQAIKFDFNSDIED